MHLLGAAMLISIKLEMCCHPVRLTRLREKVNLRFRSYSES